MRNGKKYVVQTELAGISISTKELFRKGISGNKLTVNKPY